LRGAGWFTVEDMESYEDPNHAPTDAAGERAMGHDVPVGRAAVPPVSEPTAEPAAPAPVTGPPTGDAPANQPPASWASTYHSAATDPAVGNAATGSAGETSTPGHGSGRGHEWESGHGVAEGLPRPAGFLPPSAISSPEGATATMATTAHTRTRRSGRRLALAGVAAIVLAAGGGFAGAAGIHAFDDSTASSGAAVTSVQTVAGTNSVAGVVTAVDQEVVSITVQGQQQADEGSGVVVRSDGLILTNNHVIAAAADGGTVQVTFTNGKTANATVVKADPQEDLALIQAQGVSGLKAATFGDSDNLQIGDTVIAIGNELGLSNSVSAGIVSALHRQVSVAGESNGFGRTAAQSSGTTYKDAIQTDASTNQGDSGGALFNMAGQVVGINSAIATGSSGSSGSVGIGFAISSNDAQKFVNSAASS
jgi:putative serine protease PepD